MLIEKNLVQNFIKESCFWRTNLEFEESTIEFPYYVESENVTNIEEFAKLLKFCTFIDIDQIPYSIYIYAYYNMREVIKFFENKLSNIHYQNTFQFLHNTPLDNCLTRLRELDYPEIIKTKFDELVKKYNGKYADIHICIEFMCSLLSYDSNEYYEIMEDIRKNKTLIHKMEEILFYCRNNPSFYKTSEFINKYENSNLITFKLHIFYCDENGEIDVNFEEVDKTNQLGNLYMFTLNILMYDKLIADAIYSNVEGEMNTLYNKLELFYEFGFVNPPSISLGWFTFNSEINIFTILKLRSNVLKVIEEYKIIKDINNQMIV